MDNILDKWHVSETLSIRIIYSKNGRILMTRIDWDGISKKLKEKYGITMMGHETQTATGEGSINMWHFDLFMPPQADSGCAVSLCLSHGLGILKAHVKALDKLAKEISAEIGLNFNLGYQVGDVLTVYESVPDADQRFEKVAKAYPPNAIKRLELL